jgi:hypothetical protein
LREDLQDEQDRKPILSILFILSLFFCGKPLQCLIYDMFLSPIACDLVSK